MTCCSPFVSSRRRIEAHGDIFGYPQGALPEITYHTKLGVNGSIDHTAVHPGERKRHSMLDFLFWVIHG